MHSARPLLRLRAVQLGLLHCNAEPLAVRAFTTAAECSPSAASPAEEHSQGHAQRCSHPGSAAAAAPSYAPAAVTAAAWRPGRRGYSSAAPQQEQQQQGVQGLTISDSAAERLRELAAEADAPVVLRLSIEGGGCSGFQYEFSLEEAPREGDRVYEHAGARVVCDSLSLEFLSGAVIDFESDLMRSAFVVHDNPHAAASCGCGSSFAAK